MNRLALACTITLLLLTVAAFVDHVRHRDLPGRVPPPVEPPVAASSGMDVIPTRPPEAPPPRVDFAAVRARVETEVLEPLRTRRLGASSFSRVRLPDPLVELEMEDTVRPPREDGRPFVMFRVLERRGRRPEEAEGRLLATGRVDASTLAIELAPGAADGSAFEDLEAGLVRLGVRAGDRPR